MGVAGIAPWKTPNEDFYLIDTTIAMPTIEPDDWSLRIHGMVDRELVLTYSDLVARQVTESWITLNCVCNEVGGDLVGNAWWSGVRLADLLAEVGRRPRAPTRAADLARRLDLRHPARGADRRPRRDARGGDERPPAADRARLPGAHDRARASTATSRRRKWVVDLEVTTFADSMGYWTDKGWSALGPVKIASRIDVPRSGDDVEAGEVTFGGVAWHQHTGIEAVEVQVDGGAWQRAELGEAPSVDTWVQWAVTLDVPEGDHEVRVRAIGLDGETQTSVAARARPGRRDRAAHDRVQRGLSPAHAVADDVRRPAGRCDPEPLELRAVVDATHLAVGGAGGVVDDDVTVGLEADDHEQVAVARRDRGPGELAAAEGDRDDERARRPRRGPRPRAGRAAG